MNGSSVHPLQLPDSDSNSDSDVVVLLVQPQNRPLPTKKSKAQRQKLSAPKATHRPNFRAPSANVNVAKQRRTNSVKPTKPNNQLQRERPEPDNKGIIYIHETDSEDESEQTKRHAASVPAQVSSAQMPVPDTPPAADTLPCDPTVAANKSPLVAPATEVSLSSLDADVRLTFSAAGLPPVAQAVTQPPVTAPDFFVPSLEYMNNHLPYLANYRVAFRKLDCKKPNRNSFARAYGLAPSFEQYDSLGKSRLQPTCQLTCLFLLTLLYPNHSIDYLRTADTKAEKNKYSKAKEETRKGWCRTV
jgi:hypothetical protein